MLFSRMHAKSQAGLMVAMLIILHVVIKNIWLQPNVRWITKRLMDYKERLALK